MSKKPSLGDPTLFIALAAENRLAAHREAEAWGVVEDLARAYSLRLGPPSQTAFELSAKFMQQAQASLAKIMIDPQYAALPPLAETSGHAHALVVMLLEAL